MATGYYRIYSYELKLTTDKVTTIQVKAEGDVTGLYPMLIYSIGDSEYNLCDATLVGLATGSTDVYEYEWTPPTTEIAGYIPSSESSTITFGVNTHRRGESAVVKTLKNYTGASITVNQSLKPTIDAGLTKTHDFLSESVSKITDHNITIELSCLFGASQDIEIRTDGNFNFGAHVPAFYTKTKKISAALGRFDSGDADSKKIEVDIIVTDSRGRRSSKSLFITVYKYNPPEITTAIVTRNENEQPSLEFACKYQSSVAGSTNNLKFFYIRCLNDDPDYNTDLIGKASPQELAGTYDITKTYKFEVCVKDSVAIVTTYKELVLPSEKLAMDIGADGKTVTFFGTSPSSSDKEALRIGDFASFAADKSELTKELYMKNRIYTNYSIWGLKPSSNEWIATFEPQSAGGNTVVGWGNYDKGSGDTNVYGNRVFLYAKEAKGLGFIPYYKPGDSFSIDMFTSGFITNSGTELWFTVPLDKPLLGVTSVSVTTGNGFQVRQNNKYLYGSSAGACAKPKAYTNTSLIPGKIGINVCGVFGNTTNVVNNSSCGIRAMITIKFS